MKRGLLLLICASLVLVAFAACAQAPSPTPTTAPEVSTPATAPKPTSPPATAETKPTSQPAAAPVAKKPPEKVTIAYSAISANNTALFVAKEAGYFEKYGLDANLTYLAGGSVAAAALVAGDVAVASIGGVNIIQSALAGAESVIIGGILQTMDGYLISVKDINTVQDLKGKKVGITRLGGSYDYFLRTGLKKSGLDPAKDVAILQVGGGAPQQVAALQAGAIDATLLSSPTNLQATKMGYKEILDLTKLDVGFPNTSLTTTKKLIQSNEGTILNLMKAYMEGVYRMRNDKAFAMKAIGKYTKTEASDELEEGYRFGYRTVDDPEVPLDSLKAALEFVSQSEPKAASAKPEQFLDMRFVKQLKDSGFLKDLAAQYKK